MYGPQRWPPKPSQRELQDLALAAESRQWTLGPWTDKVEAQMAEITGAPYAVAFNSCTSAIHAALHAMGCTPKTRLAVPALTFAGSVTGAAHIGAQLLFTDVDHSNLTIANVPPDADMVLAVDLHGVPHTLLRRSYAALAPVLTDACQSLGTLLDGRHIGSRGNHAWSFSAAKLVTAPDGGAVTTDDKALAERLRDLRDYGISTAAGQSRANSPVVLAGGHNWRPSELSMVLVSHRLASFRVWAGQARTVGDLLHAAADEAGLWHQRAPYDAAPAWHKVRIGPADWNPERSYDMERRLNDAGVRTHRWGVVPMHRQPAWGQRVVLQTTEAAAAGTLCLGTEACPPWTWTATELERVIRAIANVGRTARA